jgi:hypothetical protein
MYKFQLSISHHQTVYKKVEIQNVTTSINSQSKLRSMTCYEIHITSILKNDEHKTFLIYIKYSYKITT